MPSSPSPVLPPADADPPGPPAAEPAPITTRDELIRALHAAAELEHTAMCLYLFAAFTMKRRPDEGGVTWVQLERMRTWQATLLLVARQEMEHLGLVCNLLTAVGGTPHFGRPAFPQRSPLCAPGVPLGLEPFGADALAHFMAIEKGHAPPPDDEPPGAPMTIGRAYRRIRDGLERLGRQGPRLFIGPVGPQVTNATIDLRPGQYDMQLRPVHDLASALGVIDVIMEASDGPPEANPDSHYRRFRRAHDELVAAQAEDPAFAPARPVGPTPVTERQPPHPPGLVTLVEHPVTRRAALLFGEAYETMLLLLARFYTPVDDTPAERAGLKRTVFFPMMTMILRPLGELLTQMPAGAGGHAPTAGPTFEIRAEIAVHPHRLSTWTRLYERLQHMAEAGEALAAAVHEERAPWAEAVRARCAALHADLELLASNFARLMDVDELHHRHLLERVLGRR